MICEKNLFFQKDFPLLGKLNEDTSQELREVEGWSLLEEHDMGVKVDFISQSERTWWEEFASQKSRWSWSVKSNDVLG